MQDGHPAETPPPPTPPSPKAPRFKRISLWMLLVLAVVGASYGFGRWQTSKAIDLARGETEQVSQAKAALEQAVLSERDSVKRLEARRHLHLTLLALDQRNFGIAQEHIQQAGRLLLGRSSGDLETMRASLATLRLLATEDLESQRNRLLELIRRFDTAVPPVRAD